MRFCGIDIGTTNTKGVLMDRDFNLLGKIILPACLPDDGYLVSCQSWCDSVGQVLDGFKCRDLIGNIKVVCGLATQGGSFVILDRQFQPLSPGFSWLGRCSEAMVDRIRSDFGSQTFYQKTGWAPDSWLMIGKVREWMERSGVASDRVRCVSTVPDYVCTQILGRPVTDVTNAQISGLYDIEAGRWWPEILNWAHLKVNQMSQVVNRPEVVADDVDISGVSVTLTTSLHDQYAAMAACGLQNDELMLATGSAWVINGRTSKPLFDMDRFTVHPGRDLCGGFGFITSFGGVGKDFDRLLAELGIGYGDLDKLNCEFDKAGPPAMPSQKERSRGEMLRRHMEELGSRVRYMLEKVGVMDGLGKLLMTGGALGSRYWPRMISNVCGVPVEGVRFDELTAYGAARFARFAVRGDWGPDGWPKGVAVSVFEPEYRAAYDEWYVNHQRPKLKAEDIG